MIWSWNVPWSTVFILTSIPVAAVNAALIASMPAFSPGSEWLLPTVQRAARGGRRCRRGRRRCRRAPEPRLPVRDAAGAAVAADDEQAARNAETPPSAAIAAPPLSTWRRVTDWSAVEISHSCNLLHGPTRDAVGGRRATCRIVARWRHDVKRVARNRTRVLVRLR